MARHCRSTAGCSLWFLLSHENKAEVVRRSDLCERFEMARPGASSRTTCGVLGPASESEARTHSAAYQDITRYVIWYIYHRCIQTGMGSCTPDASLFVCCSAKPPTARLQAFRLRQSLVTSVFGLSSGLPSTAPLSGTTLLTCANIGRHISHPLFPPGARLLRLM